MRKACFAFVLVIAAFTGGAVMNGPGLEWLKAAIRSRVEGTATPTPTPSTTTSPVATATVAKPAEHPERKSAIHRDVPAAPLPPLTLEGMSGPASISDTTPPVSKGSAIAIVPPTPKSEAPPVGLTLPEATPVLVKDPAVAHAMQPLPAGLANLRDWNELRRRMRELGVSRYEVEGEPGGRSRFRCLIPLAGRRAVGQQFEGEGEDDFQAAEAALRRVALWKATELAPH